MRYWNQVAVVLTGLAVLAACADNVTTLLCFQKWGDAVVEASPFGNYLIEHWGVALAMAANAFWSIAILAWLEKQAVERHAWFALVIITLVILSRGWASVHNLGILFTAL